MVIAMLSGPSAPVAFEPYRIGGWRAAEQSRVTSSTASPPIRVLIVDDHGVVREGLRAYLELEPDIHVVGEARDGQEGVRRGQALQPDVGLMDLGMPNMNAVDATSRIKQLRPETHVIILTS